MDSPRLGHGGEGKLDRSEKYQIVMGIYFTPPTATGGGRWRITA
jgi:hypothetical protein